MTGSANLSRNRWIAVGAAALVVILVAGWLFLDRTDKGPASTSSSAATSTAPATTARVTTAHRTTSSPARRTTSRAQATDPASGLRWIDESALPAQARDTIALIRAGGPYPYPRNDNVTYHNNNRALPRKPDGFYREYTVTTPGSSDRGARRIIAGQDGSLYYTADHYTTFARVREGS